MAADRERAAEVRRVSVDLCDLCLNGAGGECHTPGCSLWMTTAPDVPVRTVAPLPDASQAIHDISVMLDRSYPDTLCEEAGDRRRIDKLAEEVGEVVEAYGGAVGENPRKGITHTVDDVLDELLDVAGCALGAWEHLTGNSGHALEAFAAQIVRKRDRLAAALASRGTP